MQAYWSVKYQRQTWIACWIMCCPSINHSNTWHPALLLDVSALLMCVRGETSTGPCSSQYFIICSTVPLPNHPWSNHRECGRAASQVVGNNRKQIERWKNICRRTVAEWKCWGCSRWVLKKPEKTSADRSIGSWRSWESEDQLRLKSTQTPQCWRTEMGQKWVDYERERPIAQMWWLHFPCETFLASLFIAELKNHAQNYRMPCCAEMMSCCFHSASTPDVRNTAYSYGTIWELIY